MAKRGGQTVYTDALAVEICRRMADGESLRQICRDDHMPDESTVRDWYVTDRNGFAPHYARARELQLERWADEILDIAEDGSNDWMDREVGKGRIVRALDDEHVRRSQLRIESRKWLLSKLAPKKYGDRVAVEHSGTVNADRISDAELAAVASRGRGGIVASEDDPPVTH